MASENETETETDTATHSSNTNSGEESGNADAVTSTIAAAPAHVQPARICRAEQTSSKNETETDTDTATHSSNTNSGDKSSNAEEIEYGSNDGGGDDKDNEHEGEGVHEDNYDMGECDTNEDITSETGTEDTDESSKIKVRESKGHESMKRKNQGHKTKACENKTGEDIGDWVNKPVIARAESTEQGAQAETSEQRARPEVRDQAHQVGRTHSTATPAMSGGKVQQLARIPATGLGHLSGAHLPPSKLGTKASVSQVETVVTGDKRAPTLRVYFRIFIRIFWYF